MRTQNLILFCAREGIRTIHIMLNLSMSPVMAFSFSFSCKRLVICKRLLLKKVLIFMYFLCSITLNYLPFSFVRCVLGPILQECKQKNLLPTCSEAICTKIISRCDLLPFCCSFLFLWFLFTFGSIKLLEISLMSVILQTWYCVVADHRSEGQGIFLVQTGGNSWYSQLLKVLVSIFVMNSQSEEEKWNISQAPVIQLTIVAPFLNFYWKLTQTIT